MTTVEEAEATLSELNAKRDALVAHVHDLEHKRQAIAFKAHTGNKAERTKLDNINKEALTQSYELSSLDAAIAEATQRLADARLHEAQVADRAQAQRLRDAVETFVVHGRALDAALQEMARRGQALRETLNEIHVLGSPFPSHAQLDALGALAMKAALMASTWKHAFETIPPKDRHNFAGLVEGWARRIEESSITPRLKEVA
jgi:chromosome segregation ATPase